MSYLQEFFANKNKEESMSTYFSGYEDVLGVSKVSKELRDIKKQLTDKEHEYAVVLNKSYTKNYQAAKKVPILKYESRKSGTFYFDGTTGMGLTDCPVESTIYSLNTKSGEIRMLTGYAFELGSVIVRYYNYSINGDNTQVKLNLISENLIPVLNNTGIKYHFVGGATSEISYVGYDIPGEVNASEFVNTMYDINKKLDFNLSSLIGYYKRNKATEVILKTAPDNAMKLLLSLDFDKATKLSNLLNITDEEYQVCVDNNILEEYLRVKIEMHKNKINDFKTNSELIRFIVQSQEWRKTLDFYTVNYGDYNLRSVAWELIEAYLGITYTYRGYESVFSKYYKFGTFCKYVVSAAVDQGFTSLQNFITKLGDYLDMCDRYGSFPIKETSNLLKLHNIMARNHSLSFSTEQVAQFKTKYTDFKSFTYKDYAVVAPEAPHDLCLEGDNLGHCVAFYVKKVLDDECKVFFLRLADKVKESLLTLEVKQDEITKEFNITQAEGLLSRGPSEEELEIIKAFAEDRKYGIALGIN